MPDAVPIYQWTPDYAVGVNEIDREHQGLFAQADAMHQALLAGQGKERLSFLLATLVEYTHSHFEHEERLMQRCGYPGLGQHSREHQELRARVHVMQARAASGEIT